MTDHLSRRCVALRSDISTYAGGLGVLAGDVVRTAVNLELPSVAVTLVSREGYFLREIDAEGRQIEHADAWNPAEHCRPLNAAVAISIEGRPGWLPMMKSVIAKNAVSFNSHRMMRRCVTEAYLR